VQLASSRELPRNVDIYVFREWSVVLRVLVWKVGAFGFPFGLLLPLAFVGGVAARRHVDRSLLLFLALYAASVVLVFVSGRYRAPLVPALAVLAAAGATFLYDALCARRFKLVAAGLASLVVIGSLTSLAGPFPQERCDFEAELRYMVGTRALQAGDADRALYLLEQAIARVPAHGDAHNQLGNAWAAKGRTDLALEHYRRAIELGPGNVLARDNYGRALLNEGRAAEAAQQFREALRLRPGDATLNQLYRIALAKSAGS
jgi:tetratricopeptide (TPR) repeat protein